jgi:dethiobiotin synthetase
MTTWFITGTGTDVGKTVFTSLFAKFLNEKNISITTQKWVQTGAKTDDAIDITTHDKAIKKSSDTIPDSHKKARMPYAFPLPASAHLAAKEQNILIDPEKIKQCLRFLEKNYDHVIVEGLGGIMVPLTQELTSLDLVEQLNLETIIVVPNILGAINHALLTIQALASRQISVRGFVMNRIDSTVNSIIQNDNPKIIQALSGLPCIGNINQNKVLTFTDTFINSLNLN